MELGKTVV
jgi:hypothetical protein